MIEIDSLTKNYGHHTVVDNLSFHCEPGEVLGFLGPNGAGKSTTMKLITGFVAPTSGRASVCGTTSKMMPWPRVGESAICRKARPAIRR